MELSTRVLYFSLSFLIWSIKVWGWKSARRVTARHSLSTGQVRGESNSPPLSLLEGSKVGLWNGVAKWMAESESGVDNCGALSGQEVSVDTDFDLPYARGTYGFFRSLRKLRLEDFSVII